MSRVTERLREVRDELAGPGAPSAVNLREYVPDKPLTWLLPDYRLRIEVAVAWLDDVIARLERGRTGADGGARAPRDRRPGCSRGGNPVIRRQPAPAASSPPAGGRTERTRWR